MRNINVIVLVLLIGCYSAQRIVFPSEKEEVNRKKEDKKIKKDKEDKKFRTKEDNPNVKTDILIKSGLHGDKQFIKDWLLRNLTNLSNEYQTYDGWYNNPWHPSLGSAESTLIRLLPSAYDGGVYRPNNISSANPLEISESFMQEKVSCDGHADTSSISGKNVFMVFFGLFVTEELVNTRRPSCPPSYFNIDIPSEHDFKVAGLSQMPFIRSRYEKKSGKSPNNRLKQLNGATAWIDGSAIYGTTKSEADALRSFQNGCLKSMDTELLYPMLNEEFLSYLSPSQNISDSKIKKDQFRVGNELSHENPFVLVMNILFFRLHNVLAMAMHEKWGWTDEKCFNEARRLVIAILQNIIMNEWLPAFLGEKLPRYRRYDPSIDPSISNVFQSAAMRFGHTMVPRGVYKRTNSGKCENSVIRLCDSFYNAKQTVYKSGIENLILGMVFQAAEKEDISIVDDLRSINKYYLLTTFDYM